MPSHIRPVAPIRQRGRAEARRTFRLSELIVMRNALLLRQDALQAGGSLDMVERATTTDALSVIDTLRKELE